MNARRILRHRLFWIAAAAFVLTHVLVSLVVFVVVVGVGGWLAYSLVRRGVFTLGKAIQLPALTRKGGRSRLQSAGLRALRPDFTRVSVPRSFYGAPVVTVPPMSPEYAEAHGPTFDDYVNEESSWWCKNGFHSDCRGWIWGAVEYQYPESKGGLLKGTDRRDCLCCSTGHATEGR